MYQITDADEYDEFLDTVVENRNERDPSDEYHVAQNLIVNYRDIDGEIAPTTVGEPYYDTTITPMSVINHANCDLNELLVSGIREGAVKMLATDLRDHYDWVVHHDKPESKGFSEYSIEGTQTSTAYCIVDELDSWDDVEVTPDSNPEEPVTACINIVMWMPARLTKPKGINLPDYVQPTQTTFKEGYPPAGQDRNRRVYVLDIENSTTTATQRAVDAKVFDRIADALGVGTKSLLEEIRLYPNPKPREERQNSTGTDNPPVIDLFNIEGHTGRVAIAPVHTGYLDELADSSEK